jgi:transposase
MTTTPSNTEKPRLRYANRLQGEMRVDSLEQLLPPEHRVRTVWQFVESLDLTPLLAKIRALPGKAGAPAIDPRILVALWLQATCDGIGSSRELAELCQIHLAYRWLCGGVEVGYHTLADFRTDHREVLEQLLTQSIGVMMHEELIELHRVAQDGMRVRAAAGAASFRRGESLAKCLAIAKEQVETLRRQEDEDAGAARRRQEAARQRAVNDRLARLTAAQVELHKLQQSNATQPPCRRKKDGEIRVSTTDPECRKMKMPDGGYRPGYNVQFATATVGGAIVGVDVTNEGTDSNELPPMLEQIQTRSGTRPNEAVVDGGYTSVAAIDQAERGGTKVYAPPREEQKQLQAGGNPYERKKSDTDATAAWRQRMATPEAKAIYKERASTAELTNAQARNRGLYAVRVRGRDKVLATVLWYALAHNLARLLTLRAQAEAAADGNDP